MSAAPAAPLVLCVVGARPNFVKMAPILAAFAALQPPIRVSLVHTGQHYGVAMDGQFFSALSLPMPDVNLGVGSGSHAEQTANIMLRFEPVLDQLAPAAVLVVGDVNSTLACALVACKMAVPVIHVEAGLRSLDRAMPEEINRILTDQMSALLLTSEPCGALNLLCEGIAAEHIHEVGNVMIDSLRRHLHEATPVASLLANGGRPHLLHAGRGYAVLTAHRPANVDDPRELERLFALVHAVAARLPVILPLHPRTRARLTAGGRLGLLDHPGLMITEPLGYLDMLGAMRDAQVLITDSGGVQEEALVLGVPCITLRDSTERPSTLEAGGNVLVGNDSAMALATLDAVLGGAHRPGPPPASWDGQAATRIAQRTRAWLAERSGA